GEGGEGGERRGGSGGSELGPNVTIGSGARIVRCRLRDCIVDEGSVLEDCDLTHSIVGAHAVLRGARGRVLAGDHTVFESG
ncbi:MAG: hypothetical protein ACREKI_09055, partial [Gemmatimonadota bacterium]